MTSRWADVAELVAVQGLKGRLVARSVHGLPFLFTENMPVNFVPPQLEGPRHAKVVFVQPSGDGNYIVGFDVVQNRDDAERLVGCHCLVSLSYLPDNFDELLRADAHHVTGYRVQDSNLGFLGSVLDVREMPSQNLLVVEHNGEEVYIPFVDEFVIDIDEENKIVYVLISQSLLTLNGSTDKDVED